MQGLAGQLESERARRMVAEGQVSHLEGAVREAQQRVAALQQQMEDLRRQLAQQKDLLATQKEQAEQVRLLHWSAFSSGIASGQHLCDGTTGAHVVRPKTAEGAVLHDKLQIMGSVGLPVCMPALPQYVCHHHVFEHLHLLQASGSLGGLGSQFRLRGSGVGSAHLSGNPAGCKAGAGAAHACVTGGTACEHGPRQLTRHLACSEQAASREREQHERALQQAQQATSREREQLERALQQAQQAAVAARPLGPISRRASGVSVSAGGEEGHAADKAAVATFQRQRSTGGTLVNQAAAGEGAAPSRPAVESGGQAAPVQAGSGVDKTISALDVQMMLEREGKTPLEAALKVTTSYLWRTAQYL